MASAEDDVRRAGCLAKGTRAPWEGAQFARDESAGHEVNGQSEGVTRGSFLWIITVLGFALPALAYLAIIYLYGVNYIWLDQWSDINLIAHVSSHAWLTDLWTQHLQDRMLFPNAIVLLLGTTTHLNIVFEEYLGAVMLFAATAMVIATHRGRERSRPWLYYCPVAIVMLSLNQYRDTLWGFQMAWYLVILCLAIALYLLERARLTRSMLAMAIVVAVVASYSSAQGLVVWLVGLLLLYLRQRPLKMAAVWLIAAVITFGIYLYNYDFKSSTISGSALSHPEQTVKTFLFNIGNVVGDFHSGPGLYFIYLLGSLIFLTALYVVVAYGVRPDRSGGAPVGVVLIWFGLIFVVLISVGRSSYGLALSSRYSLFNNLIVVGCYLALLDNPTLRLRSRKLTDVHTLYKDGVLVRFFGWPTETSPGRRWDRSWQLASRGLIALAIVLLAVVGTLNSVGGARAWHHNEVLGANVMVNIQTAPDDLVKKALFFESPNAVPPPPTVTEPDVRYIRSEAASAAIRHLSVYGTDADSLYRAIGLPAMTTVLGLAGGSHVHGDVSLSASVSGKYPVTGVDFILQSGNSPGRRIASGERYGRGWIASFASIGVPNGTYKLFSSAHFGNGTSVRSTAVRIVIGN